MKGKIILVTGATNGIGLEASRALAKMGARVVLVGRNPQKTAQVLDDLKKDTNNPDLDMLVGDLSLVAETRRLADEFKARYDRLDVLLNNAGAIFTSRQVTAEGFEMTFALNHLSYFVMTNALLDLLRDSAPARVINVSSSAHRMVGRLDFDNLQGEKGYGPQSAFSIYSASKLMNIMFTYELARRLEGTGITANALHPGVVRTGFGHNNSRMMSAFMRIFQGVGGISAKQGADNSVYLASSPEVANVTGKYFEKRKAVASSPASMDKAGWERLWQVSEEATARVLA